MMCSGERDERSLAAGVLEQRRPHVPSLALARLDIAAKPIWKMSV
jgi:hypothetical protein